MKLFVQPDDGLSPLIRAVDKAQRSIDILIFRFDRVELAKALQAAVERGVVVRALIAHTNRGGEKRLRKLEQHLLDAGITVARTADDLLRYHGKMLIVDDTLHVLGFNYTKLDIEQSRSFGIASTERALVKEASTLFEADRTRQIYTAGHDRLVVSPDTSRELLSAFIRGAKKQLLIYDEKVTDNVIQRLLAGRVNAGVEIRIIGKLEKALEGIEVRKLSGLRLHVRAMIRDGQMAFVGSQSLRRLELDGRREIGVIVRNTRIARKMQGFFEQDWASAKVTAAAPKRRVRARKGGATGRAQRASAAAG